MKILNFLIILILSLLAASMAQAADTYTPNLNLTLPEYGSANWNTKLNSNFTDLDSAYGTISSNIADAPEVYFYANTFNGPTGRTITLPKSVTAVTEYSVSVEATSRAGAIGDIYVTKTTSNFVVKCSEANTTDTFMATLYYEGDLNAYGSSVFRRWIVSPISGDHGDTSLTGSLAYVLNAIGVNYATVVLPGNNTYELQQNLTIGSKIELIIDRKAIIDLDHSLRSATYKWTQSPAAAAEYYLELAGGGNPGLPGKPTKMLEAATGSALAIEMTEGIGGLLAAGEWAWTDNDGLGYTTVYVRLTVGGDPDGQAVDYVQMESALTFNGSLKAGLFQIFSESATGSITLANGSVPFIYPDWWGLGGGSVDDIAINQALQASALTSPIIPVVLMPQTYTISATILLDFNHASLIGSQGSGLGMATIIALANNSDCHMITMDDGAGGGITSFVLERFELDGNSANQTSVVHGIYSQYLSNDARIVNVRSEDCKGDGFNVYFNDVSMRNIESTSNAGRGMYLRGTQNHVDGDIENNFKHQIYLYNAEENQFDNIKSERAEENEITLYLENSSRNRFLFNFTTLPANIYIDENSNSNWICTQAAYPTQIETQDHGVGNTVYAQGRESFYAGYHLDSFTSDYGTDMDMLDPAFANWTRAGTGDERKATPVSNGMQEFKRSFLIRGDDAAFYEYQDIANASIPDATKDWLFVSHVATPQEEGNDDVTVELIKDPIGVPATLYSHTHHTGSVGDYNDSDEPYTAKTKRDWGIVTIDGTKDIRVKFDAVYVSAAAHAVIGKSFIKESIVTNGSLEAFTGANPDNWTVTGTVTASQETTNQYTGSSCLKMTSLGSSVYISQNIAGTMSWGTDYLVGVRIKPLTQAWIDAVYAAGQAWPGTRTFSISIGNVAAFGRYNFLLSQEKFVSWSPPPLSPGWVSVWFVVNSGSLTTRTLFITISHGDLGGGGDFLIDDIFVVPIN